MSQTEILDCSLRDGGYRTKWHFSHERVHSLNSVLRKISIQKVEFGFKFPNRSADFGPFSNVSDALLHRYFDDDLEFGFMLEAKTCENFESVREFAAWATRDTALFSFVRVATTIDQLGQAIELARHLSDKGKKPFINVMRASELEMKEIDAICRASLGVEAVFYLADTFGALTPDRTSQIIGQMAGIESGIGFHAHDNRGMAFANTLSAISAGASYVDGTLAGHGRGSGNTKTEELAAELSGYESHLFSNLFDLGNHLERFEYEVGQSRSERSFAFHIGALSGFHPNSIIEVIDQNPTLELGELLLILGRERGPAKSEEMEVRSIVRKVTGGSTAKFVPESLGKFRGSTFFLFARGKSLEADLEDFSHFRERDGYSWGLLNGDPEEFPEVDVLFALHSFRERVVCRSSSNRYRGIRICGFPAPPQEVDPKTWNYVPVTIRQGAFSTRPLDEEFFIAADSVTAFALGILGSLGVSEICLAGFDASNRSSEILESLSTIQVFQKAFPNVALSALGENPFSLPLTRLW